MTRGLTMLFLVASAAGVGAQDDYAHGRVLAVEPGVTVQRATEAAAEEATPNLPFLPGDRVWTDHAGRAEFQFGDCNKLFFLVTKDELAARDFSKARVYSLLG